VLTTRPHLRQMIENKLYCEVHFESLRPLYDEEQIEYLFKEVEVLKSEKVEAERKLDELPESARDFLTH